MNKGEIMSSGPEATVGYGIRLKKEQDTEELHNKIDYLSIGSWTYVSVQYSGDLVIGETYPVLMINETIMNIAYFEDLAKTLDVSRIINANEDKFCEIINFCVNDIGIVTDEIPRWLIFTAYG